MAEEKDYLADVPETPPDGLLDWLLSKGALSKNVIVYRSDYVDDDVSGGKRKVVRCRCTACNREFNEEYASNGGCRTYMYTSAPFSFVNHLTKESVINGNTTMCPECAAPVDALHIGAIYGEGGRQIVDAYPMSVHRINGLIYLLSWRVAKWVNKSGGVRIEINPYEGYAFDGCKTVKIVGYSQWYFYRYTGHWERRAKCVDTYGKVGYLYPFDAEIFNGTCLENSKFDIFVRDASSPAPVTYLRIYQKHKNVENIVMQGASELLSGLIDQTQHRKYCNKGYTGNIENINWKAKRPSEMLGLNKDEFKLCVKNKWSIDAYNLYSYAKENGILLAEEDVKLCVDLGMHAFKYLLEFKRPKNVSVVRCMRYVKKQQEKSITSGYQELCDYWNMSRKLKDPLLTDAEIFPQVLKNAHDNCTMRINAEKDAKFDAEFKERYNALSVFCFEYEGLCIRPPQSAGELRAEGSKLNHCVFSYANSHASGKTAILFIRHINEPETPYFTLELDEKELTVRQNRGKCNCSRTEEVIAFEEQWLKHIHKIQKKKKEKVAV